MPDVTKGMPLAPPNTVELEHTDATEQDRLLTAAIREATASVTASYAAGNITAAERDAALAAVTGLSASSGNIAALIQQIREIASAAQAPTSEGRNKDLVAEMLEVAQEEYQASYNQILLDRETEALIRRVEEARNAEEAINAILSDNIANEAAREAITNAAMSSLRAAGIDPDSIPPSAWAESTREIEVGRVALATVRDRLVGRDSPFAGDAEILERLEQLEASGAENTAQGRAFIRELYEMKVPENAAEEAALRNRLNTEVPALVAQRDRDSSRVAENFDAESLGSGVDQASADAMKQDMAGMTTSQSYEAAANVDTAAVEATIAGIASGDIDYRQLPIDMKRAVVSYIRENETDILQQGMDISRQRLQNRDISAERQPFVRPAAGLVASGELSASEEQAVLSTLVRTDNPLLQLLDEAGRGELVDRAVRSNAENIKGNLLSSLGAEVSTMRDITAESRSLRTETGKMNGLAGAADYVGEMFGRNLLGETFMDQEIDDLRGVISTADRALANRTGNGNNDLSRNEIWGLLGELGIRRPTTDAENNAVRDMLDFNKTGDRREGQIDGQELYEAALVADYLVRNTEFKAAIDRYIGDGRIDVNGNNREYDINGDGRLNTYEAARALLDRGITSASDIPNADAFAIGVGSTPITEEVLQAALEHTQRG